MKHKIVYIGIFRLPDLNAAALRVRAIADALHLAGYEVVFVDDDYRGPSATQTRLHPLRRISVAAKRANDLYLTLSSYRERLQSIEWAAVRAVICYPGSAALTAHVTRLCRSRSIPVVIDCTEWYDPRHVPAGRWGPFALDSEIRMRWLYVRARNVICISSYLAGYYRARGCNVVRIPPLIGADEETPSEAGVVSSDSGEVRLVYAGSPGHKELFAEMIGGVGAAFRAGTKVRFDVVGVTEGQLLHMVRSNTAGSVKQLDGVVCHGRTSRAKALEIVRSADFTLLLRPQRRFANAGFPSKLVESLSLGVPVITNATSDIPEYVCNGVHGFIVPHATVDSVRLSIETASRLDRRRKDTMRAAARSQAYQCFHYRSYSIELAKFLDKACAAAY